MLVLEPPLPLVMVKFFATLKSTVSRLLYPLPPLMDKFPCKLIGTTASSKNTLLKPRSVMLMFCTPVGDE